MDHPSISISSFIYPDYRLNGLTRHHILVGLRYSSGIAGAPQGDMFVAGIEQNRLACGRRTDRLAVRSHVQDVFGNGAGQTRLERLAGRAGRRIEPIVGSARFQAPDRRFPAAQRISFERGAASGNQQSVPDDEY